MGVKVQFAFLIPCIVTQSVLAGSIQDISLVGGPATFTNKSPVFPLPALTSAPNNDNQSGFAGNLAIFLVDFNGTDYVDVQFDLANTGGVTEYDVAFEFTNYTSQTWNRMLFQLGHGTGSDFVRGDGGDGLDFDWPTHDNGWSSPITSSPIFMATVQDHTAGNLIFPNSGSTFSFAVDMPDDLPGHQFVLRVTPYTLPEPASITLLSGLLLLGSRRRRSQPSVDIDNTCESQKV